MTSRFDTTGRDLRLLAGLYLTPMTRRQMLRLSTTFPQPFVAYKSLDKRLTTLRRRDWIQKYPLVGIPQTGQPQDVFKLTLRGFRQLCDDPGRQAPTKRFFTPPSELLRAHQYYQGEFLITLQQALSNQGLSFSSLRPDRVIRLNTPLGELVPDACWSFQVDSGREYRFLLELDCGTEQLIEKPQRETIERKIRQYLHLVRHRQQKLRVIFCTISSEKRMQHILTLAGQLQLNQQQSVFLGTTLARWQQSSAPLTQAVFQNHQGRAASLIPRYHPNDRQPRRTWRAWQQFERRLKLVYAKCPVLLSHQVAMLIGHLPIRRWLIESFQVGGLRSGLRPTKFAHPLKGGGIFSRIHQHSPHG